jgi:hypothetical protein
MASWRSPPAHETRCAAGDLSDQGIDDTFVLVTSLCAHSADAHETGHAESNLLGGEAIAVGLKDSGLTLAVVEREVAYLVTRSRTG